MYRDAKQTLSERKYVLNGEDKKKMKNRMKKNLFFPKERLFLVHIFIYACQYIDKKASGSIRILPINGISILFHDYEAED